MLPVSASFFLEVYQSWKAEGSLIKRLLLSDWDIQSNILQARPWAMPYTLRISWIITSCGKSWNKALYILKVLQYFFKHFLTLTCRSRSWILLASRALSFERNLCWVAGLPDSVLSFSICPQRKYGQRSEVYLQQQESTKGVYGRRGIMLITNQLPNRHWLGCSFFHIVSEVQYWLQEMWANKRGWVCALVQRDGW